MNRRVFLERGAGGVLAVLFAASAAVADSYQSSVVSQLRAQGYREINVERTMLGRVRIVAARGGASREIILNPRTGEILRDVLLGEDGQVEPQIAGGGNSGQGSSGSSGSSDDGSSGDDGSDDSGSDDNGSDDGGSDDNGSDDGGSDDGGDSEGEGSGHGHGGDGDSDSED